MTVSSLCLAHATIPLPLLLHHTQVLKGELMIFMTIFLVFIGSVIFTVITLWPVHVIACRTGDLAASAPPRPL